MMKRRCWTRLWCWASAVMNFPINGTNDEKRDVLRKWEKQQERYLLKPMNCPHHAQMYKAIPRSYRDLPVRLAEFGTVYRHEQSGELNGLLRVRGLTQDDAHLFCTPEQVEQEFKDTLGLVKYVLERRRPGRLPSSIVHQGTRV